MTDEPTPTPPKVPPKLKIRPAGLPTSAENDGNASEQAEPRKETAADTPQAAKPANAPAKQSAIDKDREKPAVAEAPTLVLKKSPGASAESQNKKKTSRIPLDVALTSRIDSAMEAPAGEAPKTIRLARPGSAKPAAPATDSGGAAPKTIRLGSPTAPPASNDADSGPKTIRLQRPVDAPTKIMSDADSQPPPKSPSKSKTSRISLDEVLKPDVKASGGGEATGVKTIRLKKPGEAAPPQAPPPEEAATPEVDAEKSRTARLDSPETAAADSNEGAPATQRKTIRIKRPDGTVAGGGSKPARKLTLAKDAPQDQADAGSDETAEPEAAVEPESAKRSDDQKIGLVWSLTAVAAALVAAVVVYVLAVQAFPGADLTWPGQINL